MKREGLIGAFFGLLSFMAIFLFVSCVHEEDPPEKSRSAQILDNMNQTTTIPTTTTTKPPPDQWNSWVDIGGANFAEGVSVKFHCDGTTGLYVTWYQGVALEPVINHPNCQNAPQR